MKANGNFGLVSLSYRLKLFKTSFAELLNFGLVSLSYRLKLSDAGKRLTANFGLVSLSYRLKFNIVDFLFWIILDWYHYHID